MTILPLCCDGRVIMGAEREPPEFGEGGLAVSYEECVIVFGENCDGHLFEDYVEVVAVKRTNAHQVVMKFGHHVAGSGWEGGEEEVA